MVVFQTQAGIAQSVEHFTRNEGVVSSSLIFSLFKKLLKLRVLGAFCKTIEFHILLYKSEGRKGNG